MKDVAPKPFAMQIQKQKEFFNRSLSCFVEEDGGYQPRKDMLSVAGQINHVTAAQELLMSGVVRTLDKFSDRQWISRRSGASWTAWGMEWAKTSNLDPQQDLSLHAALQAFNETMDLVEEVFGGLTPEELQRPIAPNPMHIATPMTALGCLIDHTAHHRGALAQYARLLGKDPKIPYFEMSEALHEAQIAG